MRERKPTVAKSLSSGWPALRRAAWEESRRLFEHDLADRELPDLLEGLSWAAWWMNDGDVVLDARERAYRLYRQAEDHRGAARMAVWMASDVLDFRGEPAVAAGWLRRAHRVLDAEPLCEEHGWLAVHEGTIALDLEGDTVTARRLGAECTEIGRRFGVIDLEVLGLALGGQAAVHEGEVGAGMAALDEAVAAAVAGELAELVSVGWSCCSLIKACEQVRDHDRAAQWSKQTIAFAERVRFDPWFGICRAFYATVLVWRGNWVEAEAELTAGLAQMAATRPPWAAEASVRLGELRACQGRFDDAERIFAEVDFHPRAQLGLATIALARDDPTAAIALVERVLRGQPAREKTGRVPALELLVRACVAAGDVQRARAMLTELSALVAGIGTPTLRASVSRLEALTAAGEGKHALARASFEDALDLLGRCGAQFEAACVRVELARSLHALGDEGSSRRELEAAFGALSTLGADHHSASARDALARVESLSAATSRPLLTDREVQVLRLIASGSSDKDIAATLHLSEHTVHRHVSNILTKLAAKSRAAAVATASQTGLI